MPGKPEITQRDIIRHGYRIGAPCKVIAELCGSTPNSVKVIAHNMGLVHATRVPIPADKLEDYQFFTRRKQLPAAYVRRLLDIQVAQA